MAWEYLITGGGLLAIIGLILANNRENDKKITRSYERLDEVKAYQEQTYTRKDVCAVRHEQLMNTLNEMRGDIKKILTNNRCK
jgi:hypothetical protein